MSSTPNNATSDRMKGYGQKAWNWSYKVSDKLAVYANAASHKVGGENFWPAAGDTPQEIEKCIRILKTFTEEGVQQTETKEVTDAQTGQKVKKSQKVLKKIPSSVIRQAKGLAIYTAFRSGIAPFSGAGGCGMVVARLPDGSWSAPASIMPNNVSGGLMVGMDIYDVVLILRTQKALESFYSHKVSVGAEIGVAAGPYGAGAILESGKELTPCWSYVKSRGFYAGVEAAAALLVSRYDEMGRFYHRPGVRAVDVLTGKVHMPYEARPLLEALRQAEQLPVMDNEVIETPDLDSLDLEENETLHLPPTPSQMAMDENMDFKEAWQAQDRQELENEEDEKVYQRTMAPPPKHHSRKLSKEKASTSASTSARQSPVPGPSASTGQPEPLDRSSSSEYSAEKASSAATEEEDASAYKIPTPPRASQETSRPQTPQESASKPALPPRRRPVPPPPTQQQQTAASPSVGSPSGSPKPESSPRTSTDKAAEAAKDAMPDPSTTQAPPPTYSVAEGGEDLK